MTQVAKVSDEQIELDLVTLGGRIADNSLLVKHVVTDAEDNQGRVIDDLLLDTIRLLELKVVPCDATAILLL